MPHTRTHTHTHTHTHRSIAEEAGADKDIVQRTHSLALENARRREELQVGEIEKLRAQVPNRMSSLTIECVLLL